MRTFTVSSVVCLSGIVGMGGCADPVEGTASPRADLDALEAQQLITNVNADGTWTADAYEPVQPSTKSTKIYAAAKFTGPSGKTRKMGVCGLLEWTSGSGAAQPCSSVNDCGSAPSSLPSGGSRYCTAPNGVGQKYCYYRPGYPSTYCAGSPVNGGVPVAPGYMSTPQFTTLMFSRWISYACFEGCAASDPSSSSWSVVVKEK